MSEPGHSSCLQCGWSPGGSLRAGERRCPKCGALFGARRGAFATVGQPAGHSDDAACVLAPEDEALVTDLQSAFEYYVEPLAKSSVCWLGDGGGSNSAVCGAMADPPFTRGTRLDDFEVIEELGRGGMGVVYRAVQCSLGREVALKVLPGFARFGRTAVQRFRTEAAAAARLHHTNLVSVYAEGEHDGQYYYAMELVEGGSLDVAMRAPSDWLHLPAEPDDAPTGVPSDTPPARTVRQPLRSKSSKVTYVHGRTAKDYRLLALRLAEVAEALAFAHQRGVIHRDVKPHNLLLGNDGRLQLTDFGLARLDNAPQITSPGEVMGTPAYVAPEQVRGQTDRIDQRTDVYSLGVTLYELLTQRKPFRGESREQIMLDVCSEEPTAPRKLVPQIPVDLETICLCAMAKESERRYPTATAMAEDLRRVGEGRRIRMRRPSGIRRASRWIGRHRAVSLATVTSVVALCAIAASTLQARSARMQDARQLMKEAYEQLAYHDYRTPDHVEAKIKLAMKLGLPASEAHLAQALAAHGRLDEKGAATHLGQLLDTAPDDLRAAYLLACAQWSDGDTTEAMRTYAQAEQRGPPVRADAWFFRGLAIHFADPAAAIESYRQAISVRAREHGFYPQAVLHLARARNQQLYSTRSLDSFSEAVESLEQLVAHELFGAYPHYLLSIAHRFAAEVYRGSSGTRGDSLVDEHYAAALDWARHGQQIDPEDDRPVTAEAECLESMGRLEEAIGVRTRAIDTAHYDQARWEGVHYRWRLRFWTGDYDGALADLEACSGFDPTHRGYSSLYPAIVLAEMGDHDAALQRVRSLVESETDHAQDLIWAATGMRLLGREDEAQALLDVDPATLDYATGLAPPQSEAWIRKLFDFCREGGSITMAELEALAKESATPWKLWGEAYFHGAAMALAAGDRPKARDYFRQAYRSFDSELRYAYHGKLLWTRMQADPLWPAWISAPEDRREGTE